MSKERIRLIIRLGIGVVSIALVCALIILGLRVCSRFEPEPTIDTTENPAQSEQPNSSTEEQQHNDALTDYKDSENNATWGQELAGSYQNNKVLTYDYGGGTISLGVNAPDVTKALYLNPSCSIASASGVRVGFFISASSPGLYYSSREGSAADQGKNKGVANFVLLGETYDTAIPAAYVSSENYGVRWERDPLAEQDNGETTLYIRAVNLGNGQPLALCRATVVYDENTNSYSLATLTSADVVDTGEMTEEEKDSLVEQAVQFMVAQNIVNPTEGWSAAKESALVEHVPTTYFPWFLGPNGEQLRSYDKPYQNGEIWAVNLPLASYNVTVYFAPYLQAVLGFEHATTPGSDELNLVPIGCARLDPRTESSITQP